MIETSGGEMCPPEFTEQTSYCSMCSLKDMEILQLKQHIEGIVATAVGTIGTDLCPEHSEQAKTMPFSDFVERIHRGCPWCAVDEKEARFDCHGGPGTTTPACGACTTCLLRRIEELEAQVAVHKVYDP